MSFTLYCLGFLYEVCLFLNFKHFKNGIFFLWCSWLKVRFLRGYNILEEIYFYSLWYQLIWLGKYLAELIRNFAWKEEDNWKRKNWGIVSLIRCWMRGEVIWKVTFFAGTSGDMVEVEGQKHFNCHQFPLGTSQWFPLGKEWEMKAPAGMSGRVLFSKHQLSM